MEAGYKLSMVDGVVSQFEHVLSEIEANHRWILSVEKFLPSIALDRNAREFYGKIYGPRLPLWIEFAQTFKVQNHRALDPALIYAILLDILYYLIDDLHLTPSQLVSSWNAVFMNCIPSRQVIYPIDCGFSVPVRLRCDCITELCGRYGR